jgi:RNA polymerase sigma-70 factor (ECF subfamily)
MRDSTDGRHTADAFAQILASAKNGSMESLGSLLEPCRQYLLLIANQELNPTLAAKVGASDLVQDAFLTAGREFGHFRGATCAEFLGWLRQILLNHLLTVQRRYIAAKKRSARREVSLDGYFLPEANSIPADISSPSNHCMRGELKELVEAALARLPQRYQLIINLRHRQAHSFEEVARRLKLSSPAARQLWSRAISRLQKDLHAAEII